MNEKKIIKKRRKGHRGQQASKHTQTEERARKRKRKHQTCNTVFCGGETR
jgi:hypothetical protein